jgi:hypothetical protein
VIYPFHPIAIYTNPVLLKYLLDPIFINQESGNWPNSYAIHDIGASFPNATGMFYNRPIVQKCIYPLTLFAGHPDGNAEAMPLEECGNMVLMTLAYAQRANDTAYLAQHYDILDAWTQYLIAEALIPADQISTDDFAGSLAYIFPSSNLLASPPTNLPPPQKPNQSRPKRHPRHLRHVPNRNPNLPPLHSRQLLFHRF